MDKLANLLGLITLFSVIVTLLNFFYKRIRQKYLEKIKKNETFKSIDSLMLKYVIKKHQLWGYLSIGALLLHTILQIKSKGINIAGSLSAMLLIIQVGLGYYGSHKPKNKQWIVVHRAIGFGLIIGILIHLLTKTIVL